MEQLGVPSHPDRKSMKGHKECSREINLVDDFDEKLRIFLR